ncbi:YciI family protein [Angustibacter luteus]|uniref:YciI family protein n=1 Tax=Angustibacter luteus TaxID=658456 RepID=A0ABW1JE79_9ACTN
MKYVIMFTSEPAQLADVPAERLEAIYGEVYTWFDKYGPSFADGGAELQPVTTATTVKAGRDGGEPVVVDGPFSEAKEVVGGFSILDVEDLDAAIAIARTWPYLVLPGISVEVRPIVDHSGDM